MATRFGRWVRGETLDAGGQGCAFFATDSTGEHQGTFVLKLLHDSKHSLRANRYPAEVTALERLTHPRIIRVVDHAPLEAQEKRYIVMPYAAGGPLSKRAGLYQEQVDPTLYVAEQLCEALICANGAGIVHRDLKPANILFDAKDSHDCLLADFGICYVPDLPRVTEEREWAGPRAYIAPELEGGDVEPTFAADLYSLGKVIYFMFSGGIDLPRERHREPRFAEVLQGSDMRVQAFAQLLDELLCPVAGRLGEATEVRERLREIRGLTADREAPSVSAATLARLGTLAAGDRARMTLERENAEISRVREARIQEVVRELAETVIEALQSLTRQLEVTFGDALELAVLADAGSAGSPTVRCRESFYVRRCVGLFVRRRATQISEVLTFVIGSGEPRHTTRLGTEQPQRQIPDCPMGLLPMIVPPPEPGPERVVRHKYLQATDPPIADPHNRADVIAWESTLRRWPIDRREYRETTVRAVNRFLDYFAAPP